MFVARIVRVWLFAALQLVALAIADAAIDRRGPLAAWTSAITGRDRDRSPGPFVVRAQAPDGPRTRVVRRTDGQVIAVDRAPAADAREARGRMGDWRRWLLVLVAVFTLAHAVRTTASALRARALELAQPVERDLLARGDAVRGTPTLSSAERAPLP